jgi:PPOX class probable F420-dependent enzyme
MSGYGIAASAEGQLSWDWARARLAGARHYWLATTGPDGSPHLAAVWAVWFDGQLCFSTGGRSRKARNLDDDPRCTLAVEPAEESLVVRGTARRMDADELPGLLAAYRAKYGDEPPDPAGNPVFAVRPEHAIGLVETDGRFTTSATRWRPD